MAPLRKKRIHYSPRKDPKEIDCLGFGTADVVGDERTVRFEVRARGGVISIFLCFSSKNHPTKREPCTPFKNSKRNILSN